ncbi:glycosyltransferase family 4 protein [Bacillus salinus]|uniref:glycosyltransferase family 4 protein n=1 Tax=Bacillus sp. HMF5848 TaxID=2495421 RepID=UPI00163ACC4F|nr:glycosyltransferase family 4 protein [Bacillus sp. HMF5848]
MKRVLFVAHENTKGGATHSLINILDSLPENIQPYVLIPKTISFRMLFSKEYRALVKAGTLKQALIERNIPFYEAYYYLDNIKVKQSLISMFFYWIIRTRELKKIKRKIKEDEIEIVHSNSSVIRFGAELAEQLKLRHIWHVREDVTAMFGISGKDLEMYIRNIIENADKVIFVAESLKKTFQLNLNHKLGDKNQDSQKKFIRVYNGIPVSPHEKTVEKIDDNKIFNIYCFGTIYEIKGQEDLIILAKKLVTDGYRDFKIKLVGSRKKTYYKYILNLIEQYNLEDYIKFINYTNDLDFYRNDASVEIITSRNEAFGRVAIEAMSFGNPLIVTNVGGLSEIVEQGKSGLKYEPGDVDKLFEYVKLIMNDEIVVEELVNNAKKRAEEFDIKECVSQISNLYY